jgi:glutamine amidotransferase
MCRLAAYLGPSVSLARLLYEPEHSLEQQSYAARELIYSAVNVDGTGVVWWPEGEELPIRYITDRPPWSDPNLPGLAPRIRSGAILAAVRSASPGIPYGTANVGPYVHGRLAGVHNGFVDGFRGPLGRALIDALPDHLHRELASFNDSHVLFLRVVSFLEEGSGLPEAVQQVLAEVASLCTKFDQTATLNLALADGAQIIATRASFGARLNSLYRKQGSGAIWVASEPLDGEGWVPIADGVLLRASAGSCEEIDLGEDFR